MQIKILKDFKWTHQGKIHSYATDVVAEVHSKDAESMIKHGYAELFVETKMQEHAIVEDKMMHAEVENKSNSKKSKK